MPPPGESPFDELVRAAGVLADEKRLKVLAAVVLGAGNEEQIARSSGLSAAEVQRALARLLAAGLLVSRPTGLAARPEQMGDLVRQVRQAERSKEPSALDLGATPEQAPILDRFLSGGRLSSIPVKGRRRSVVLDFLAGRFVPGRKYPEKEVNEILSVFHDDFATLRRYLVDEELLEREGGLYWRSGGTFLVD